ncbi:hypothetical protein RIF29_13565 [Crotalaria pallida]|uniref:Uncharacterized protein n=1 Tax=Crotalaria pallida TaxID=3830 RepID=A0AAN9P387_CROPI
MITTDNCSIIHISHTWQPSISFKIMLTPALIALFPCTYSLYDHIHLVGLEMSPRPEHMHPPASNITNSSSLLEEANLHALFTPGAAKFFLKSKAQSLKFQMNVLLITASNLNLILICNAIQLKLEIKKAIRQMKGREQKGQEGNGGRCCNTTIPI